MGSLGEMVCDGGMIAMVSYGSMGLVFFFFHKLHWYNDLFWVAQVKWFVIYSSDEMARHGWNE